MQVSVTFRHVDSSPALRDYAIDKVERVAEKYFSDTHDAHVILSVVKREHQAEINLHASRFDVSAHERTGDLYSAIDLACDKVERQLRKHKDKIRHHKGRGPSTDSQLMVPVDVIDSDDFEETGSTKIIETDSIPAKPMSIEDAVLQLELKHAEFLVFQNSATSSISVVYRRKDGNFGLITPNS